MRSKQIIFLDLEANFERKEIFEYACYAINEVFHRGSDLNLLAKILLEADYVVAHNLWAFDLPILEAQAMNLGIDFRLKCIDSLYVSVLCFPSKLAHGLNKDYRFEPELIMNNPLIDAKLCAEVFIEAVQIFSEFSELKQAVFYALFKKFEPLRSFFHFFENHLELGDLGEVIRANFPLAFCTGGDLTLYMEGQERFMLGFALAYAEGGTMLRLAPWLLAQHPILSDLLAHLRSESCGSCAYCQHYWDPVRNLKHYFGYDAYRKFGGKDLQLEAVQGALKGDSMLVIFPTGGGKSITFQIPALMVAAAYGQLTVIISPLQSLMKDQVDQLEAKGHGQVGTINGLLNPIERSLVLERVASGQIALLYLSPEALRSYTVERLLRQRNIARFVIDEAHCLSAWGQDFRIDYLYIANFIKKLQVHQNTKIPVSCFTATAKLAVVKDIQQYFKEKLNQELMLLTTSVTRTNLEYKVLELEPEKKYAFLRNLLQEHQTPSIVYLSSTNRANSLAEQLVKDGFKAGAYHGKMDTQDKVLIQNAFMQDDLQIVVATSAFGMGVDKSNVGLVVHYEISDSLENYVQEAGRAGRDQKLEAKCYVLFHQNDLSRHFMMLNQSMLNRTEIQSIWKAVQKKSGANKNRLKLSLSALQLAREAGWPEGQNEQETKVKAAIAALEDAKYLRRDNNLPKIYASSLKGPNASKALDLIYQHPELEEQTKQNAIRIIKFLYGSRQRQRAEKTEVGEARLDYLADKLGVKIQVVQQTINLLKQLGILGDDKELQILFSNKNTATYRKKQCLDLFKLENFFVEKITEGGNIINLKKINEEAQQQNIIFQGLQTLKTLILLWVQKKWLLWQPYQTVLQEWKVQALIKITKLKEQLNRRQTLILAVLEYLEQEHELKKRTKQDGDYSLDCSVVEITGLLNERNLFLNNSILLSEIEDALFFLDKLKLISIEGGFMIIYNRLQIERLETSNAIQYKKEDYKKLQQHYQQKTEQIHIVGRYANLMIKNPKQAQDFVLDYFTLDYYIFLKKYFNSEKDRLQLSQRLAPQQYEKIFGGMSEQQEIILKERDKSVIVVAAGPGSGKTRILVHKLAQILLLEDVKPEQLLMLTFSRAAVTEFKLRLKTLIHNLVYDVQIRTFHSYAFEVLGHLGRLQNHNEDIILQASQLIAQGGAEAQIVSKSVLVIDEAQDMGPSDWALVKALKEQNEDLRLILVGDDDQNIYAFRGSSSKYMAEALTWDKQVQFYELNTNYRSLPEILSLSEIILKQLSNRLKKNPIQAFNQNEQANIKIQSHNSSHFMPALLQDLEQSLNTSSSIAILTRYNEEALLFQHILLKKKYKVNLIQNLNDVKLINICELNYFIRYLQQALTERRLSGTYIDPNLWEQAKNILAERFNRPNNLAYVLINSMLTKFELQSGKHKYLTDFEQFCAESAPEDFIQGQTDELWLGTMHKAKGKEFDQVFLYLSCFDFKPESLRLLYVAFTRARKKLFVYTKQGLLDNLFQSIVLNEENYSEEKEIILQLKLKDVFLDDCFYNQNNIRQLYSGDVLFANEQACYFVQENYQLPLFKFSSKFKVKLQEFKAKNYQITTAKIRFMIFWQHEKQGELIVPLIDLMLMKS